MVIPLSDTETPDEVTSKVAIGDMREYCEGEKA
jgi:hypothetical protein